MSSNQPTSRKRKRDKPSSSKSPPPELLPLVQPEKVLRSSKDPNRGMYPRGRRLFKRNASSLSSSGIALRESVASTSSVEESRENTACSNSSGVKSVENTACSSRNVTVSREDSACSNTSSIELFENTARSRTRGIFTKKNVSFSKKNCAVTGDSFSSFGAFKEAESGIRLKRRRLSEDEEVVLLNTFTTASSLMDNKNKNSSFPLNEDKVTNSQNTTDRIFPSLPSTSKSSTKKSKFPPVSAANRINSYFKLTSPSKIGESSKSTSIPNAKGPSIGIANSEARNKKIFGAFQNCFGLVGDYSEPDEQKPQYLDQLPDHVLETILCQFPVKDLLKSRLVCKRWNALISHERFVPWKKRYFRLLYLGEDTHVSRELRSKDIYTCIPTLVMYMRNNFGKKLYPNMFAKLESNTVARTAKLVMKERFPYCANEESEVWCVLCIAVILCNDVAEIIQLYEDACQGCGYFLPRILDAMYAITAFFYKFKQKWQLNCGFHYRLHTALHTIENNQSFTNFDGSQSVKVLKGAPGQQSIHSYCDSTNAKLTYEQIRILNHCLQPNQIIKIVALAGTGKTTTLIHLAQRYPQVKFLNVMYNKGICEDAKKRFPSNVTCRTMHSLAYEVHGKQLRYKLTSKIRPHELVSHLQHEPKINMHTYSQLVLRTIERFTATSAFEFCIDHVPLTATSDSCRTLTQADRTMALSDANHIWKIMIDRTSNILKVTHDVYLKLYHLSKPDLTQYQCLMVDEAQDCNPAMLDIVMSQNLPVILVGDPHQQIYEFRGAKNALKGVNATHTYYLTKSFRFGPEIGYIATMCLDVLKDEKSAILIGNEKTSYIDGTEIGQVAIIARTNFELFKEAVSLIKTSPSNTPIQAAFTGGLTSYNFGQIGDIHTLFSLSGDAISCKFISKFKTFRDLSNYAKNVDDIELLNKIQIVNFFGADIPELLQKIKERCSYPMELAKYVFSTAHKAKGLEFDTVRLSNDFIIPTVFDPGYFQGRVYEEECNIFYVAVTRAKRSLVMSSKLLHAILYKQENFEKLMYIPSANANDTPWECGACAKSFEPWCVLSVYRPTISAYAKYSNRAMGNVHSQTLQSGFLCKKCCTRSSFRPKIEYDVVDMMLDKTTNPGHQALRCLVGAIGDNSCDSSDDERNYFGFDDEPVEINLAGIPWIL